MLDLQCANGTAAAKKKQRALFERQIAVPIRILSDGAVAAFTADGATSPRRGAFFFASDVDAPAGVNDSFPRNLAVSASGLLRLFLFTLPPAPVLLRDLQGGVFVALDHRAKLSGRDVLNDAAGFFDSGAEFF